MMISRLTWRVLLLVCVLSSLCQAESYTDTFAGGVNGGGWNFNGSNSAIIPTGGNPDEWLGAFDVDTFGPSLVSAPDSLNPFVGDYVARGVTSIGLDAQSSSQFPTAGDPAFSITLVLRDGKGTPFDPFDDNLVYFIGDLIPQPADGWKSYSFDVPSDFVGTLPPGWHGGSNGEYTNGLPAGVTFADVISNVSQVEFLWLDPEFFAIFQQWDVGADNIFITEVPEPTSAGLLALAGCLLLARRGRIRG